MSSPAWQPDCGDGNYRNPILHADYSDPDAVRVGDDFYLVSSSFNSAPALPVLHSRDLVNWRIINHALPRLVPADHFSVPRHGQGVWAPSIRHHAGKFWIYYPDPDFGIYVITAEDPAGRWSDPVLVKGGKGLIDPCPLWDEDGRVWLVHAWARSRAGIKNRITLLRLSADGLGVAEDLGVIIDGAKVPVPGFDTLEGPKLYKRNGWYYVFGPAGGVATGWQSVFRARDIRGPYEHRIVLAQGKTAINGPHQGALVDTPAGESWFLHFQDLKAYGRIVHLQPVVWRDDWPVMGNDEDGDGTGDPVLVHPKPRVPAAPLAVPASGDEFDSPSLGRQWQWQANPGENWHSLSARPGWLRLAAQPEPQPGNLYQSPALLLQKFPALSFRVTARVEFAPQTVGESTGLIVFGYAYSWIGLRARDNGLALVWATRPEAAKGAPQEEHLLIERLQSPVWLSVLVHPGARCQFAFSTDGTTFTDTGREFTATEGHWVGAKIGLFAAAPAAAAATGHADFDWFRVQPLQA
ncbi:glycosyl hydrolase 43 family protein [Oleiharenicola lentus]|uniref:Glycosyl hydrolase 43 family protein n=1 Tax=Oleiharenicola lentus TaxID=2508720 RepID=A0A4Q1CB86_9BACT|nr:glycoside hydrolase 43 family protein [Oleiharenicola lentus]RXK56171.1 glycosyl hydrolase 43 family protein [Oleiharenicola lentus]